MEKGINQKIFLKIFSKKREKNGDRPTESRKANVKSNPIQGGVEWGADH